MKHYIVYTDGSCHNNGKENAAAGWGAVIIEEGTETNYVMSGKVLGEQTNNRAELSAVADAITNVFVFAEEPFMVTVMTDSSYIANAVNNKWLHSWVKNGWKTSAKKPVENVDLWKRVIDVCNRVYKYGEKVKFEHVEGHADNKYNKMADKLANIAADKYSAIKEIA